MSGQKDTIWMGMITETLFDEVRKMPGGDTLVSRF